MRMSLSRWIVCLAALAGVAAAHASSQGAAEALVRIELAPSVRVSHPEVSLGDIAALSTGNLQVLKRLMALPLGPGPHAGEPVRLSRGELMRWIQARTGIDAGQIAWEGPQATQLYRASSDIPGGQLVAAAGDSLRAWLAELSTRAQVTPESIPRDVVAPFGQSLLKVRPIPAHTPVSRHMLVWVDVWVEGSFVRSVPVGFEVQAFAPAFVAARDMDAGSRVEASVFAVREVELTGRIAPPLAPRAGSDAMAADAEGKQLRNALHAGHVLTRQDVQAQPAIVRGDWIALRVHSGAIELESRVEALQNGRIGQTVSVKPSNASVPILAHVIGPGQVEITQ